MSNRPSKYGTPDVAPVMRLPDGKLTTRPPFTPSKHQEERLKRSAWNRAGTREGGLAS